MATVTDKQKIIMHALANGEIKALGTPNSYSVPCYFFTQGITPRLLADTINKTKSSSLLQLCPTVYYRADRH